MAYALEPFSGVCRTEHPPTAPPCHTWPMAHAIRPNSSRVVLIVDGHSDTRQMLRAWLEMGGFSVLEAATGVEALDIVAASPPDVISTEMWLSGFDGYELCRWLRANPETRVTPIIALTSRGMPHEVERAIQAGCNAVLVKPSVPAELEDTITRLLPLAA